MKVLRNQLPTIEGFDWDDEDDPDGNVQHITCKDQAVYPWEVQQVIRSEESVWFASEDAPDNAYTVVGPTHSARFLRVHGCVFENPPKKGWWRNFTAFDASKTWKAEYDRYLPLMKALKRSETSAEGG